MDRLSRFFKLVHNEYTKIFKKGGTAAILILMTIVVIVFEILLCATAEKRDSSDGMAPAWSEENYNNFYNSIGHSNDAAKAHKLELLEYMKNNSLSTNTWGGNLLMVYVNHPYAQQEDFPKDEVARIKEYIAQDDWKGCYSYALENTDLPEDMRWEMNFRAEHNIKPQMNDHTDSLIDKIRGIQADTGGKGTLTQSQKDKIAVCTYQLEHDITINVADYTISESVVENTWGAWTFSSGLIYVVAVAMMIFAGNIVANEYSQGTIKFLLVNPVKRWKILASKLFTVMTLAFVLLLIVFIFSGLCASLFIGANGQKAAWLTVTDGKVRESSALAFIIEQWLLQSITLFVLVTLAFSLSTFSRKSSVAISLSIVCIFVGNTITSLLAVFECDWGRFLLFANLDIRGIAAGESMFYRQSVGFAVFVLVEHMVVFIITAFDSFRRKSV